MIEKQNREQYVERMSGETTVKTTTVKQKKQYVTPISVTPETRRQFVELQRYVNFIQNKNVTQDELIRMMITTYKDNLNDTENKTS